MYERVSTDEDRIGLQKDTEKLSEWSEDWQLKFNTSKCSVMHLGYNNPKNTYTMKDNEGREKTLEVTDFYLGVHVHSKLTFHEHTSITVGNANRILGVIKRTFTTRASDVIKRLYYHGSAMHPAFISMQETLTRWKEPKDGQQSCTQRSKGFPYEERLQKLKLPSLYFKRQKGDMIQVYKIVIGKDRLDQAKLLPASQVDRTRGQSKKMMKRRSRLKIRKRSFSLRVVDDWNSLPDWVVDAADLKDFQYQTRQVLAK